MKNGIEIRWHGRGGQGAKTAALLLADVAFKTGKNVQGFRNMARSVWEHPLPHTTASAATRFVFIPIYHPDYVVVVDETLLHTVDVTAGLKEQGLLW